MTIQEAKINGKNELTASPTAALDTEVLLQHITGYDKTHLLLHRDDELTAAQEERFCAALTKRKTGFPIAYITGHKEFFGYDFYVTPDVLIPKPDTELLVELALAAIEDKQAAHPGRGITVCDMCTGSGCVGISIHAEAQKRAQAHLTTDACTLATTLVDISEKALEVARTNASRLLAAPQPATVPNCELHFVQSNLFENIPHTFDLIATNPPYVPHTQARELLTDGRSEPLLALDGDVTETGEESGTDDGLFLIRRLIPQCYAHLAANGVLLMETGEYNAEEAAGLCEQAGFRNVHIERDISGQLRIVCGVK